MPVLPGAEPWSADGGRTGALLVHGFTGHPGSMRPWAEYLAGAGLAVRLPRLPGHGTRWQDLGATDWTDWYGEAERGFDDLRTRCDEVFVLSLSMGGALSLRLAEQRPAQVAGQVLVNPAIATDDWRMKLLPVLSRVIRSVPPIGSDIKKPGVTEGAYDRVPTQGALALTRLFTAVQADLAKVVAPTLVLRSTVDHVVPKVSVDTLVAGATNAPIEVRDLADSYHVATLDNDAPAIFDQSLMFIRAHSRIGA